MLGLSKLADKIANGEELSDKDLKKIKKAFEEALGDSFTEKDGFWPEYNKLLQSKGQKVLDDLDAFKKKIPALKDFEDKLSKETDPKKLRELVNDLQTAQKLLRPDGSISASEALKLLKSIKDPKLRKQVASFLGDYLLDSNETLEGFDAKLFSNDPEARLEAIAKALGKKSKNLLSNADNLKKFALADPMKKLPYTATLADCIKAITTEEEAQEFLRRLAASGQLPDLSGMEGMSALEILSKLPKLMDPNTLLRVDQDYAKRVANLPDSFNAQEDQLRSFFPGDQFGALFDEMKKDNKGGVLVEESQAKRLWDMWEANPNNEERLKTNPGNVLRMIKSLANTKDGHLSPESEKALKKYSLLLGMWLNSNLPGSFSIKELSLSPEKLISRLEKTFDKIGNLKEVFTFSFAKDDLPAEFSEASLPDLIQSRSDVWNMLNNEDKKIIQAFGQDPNLEKTEGKYLLVEKAVADAAANKPVASVLEVNLTTEEAHLMRDLLGFLGVKDDSFSRQFAMLDGQSSNYSFDPKNSGLIPRLIQQVKFMGAHHKGLDFDQMTLEEVAACLDSLQTFDGGHALCLFAASKLSKSEVYGEDFCEFLAQSSSVPLALHRYSVWIHDKLHSDLKQAAIVLLAREEDPDLKRVILERQDYMSSEELLEFLQNNHPFKLEALLKSFYVEN